MGIVQYLLSRSVPWAKRYSHLSSPLSLNREGRWGTTDDFAISFLHFSQFSTTLWDMANSRPVHFLMLSFQLFLCLPRMFTTTQHLFFAGVTVGVFAAVCSRCHDTPHSGSLLGQWVYQVGAGCAPLWLDWILLLQSLLSEILQQCVKSLYQRYHTSV